HSGYEHVFNCSQCVNDLPANSSSSEHSNHTITSSNNNNNTSLSNNIYKGIDPLKSSSTLTFDTILDSLVWVSRGQDTRLKALVCGGQSVTREPPRLVATADHIQVLCTGSLIL